MLKKSWGFKISALGIVLILVGFYYDGVCAGLPFQDSELVPKQILEEYNRNRSIGNTFYNIGFPVLMMGILVWIGKLVYVKMSNH
jgi:hypothetical protein